MFDYSRKEDLFALYRLLCEIDFSFILITLEIAISLGHCLEIAVKMLFQILLYIYLFYLNIGVDWLVAIKTVHIEIY